MIDYFNQNYEYLLNGIIIALTVKFILKYHRPIMNFIGKVVKFSQVYITPLMFIIIAWIDPKYNLLEKQILTIFLCGLGMAFGYLYRLAEKIDDNQQKSYP